MVNPATALMRPTFARYYRAPSGWYADDHPWVVRFGHRGNCDAACSCCSAGLVRHAIEDTEGNVWGVDCWRTATGQQRPEVRVKDAVSVLQLVTRRGYRVWANGAAHLLDAIPAGLYAELSKSDQRRVDRRESRR